MKNLCVFELAMRNVHKPTCTRVTYFADCNFMIVLNGILN